MNYQGEKSNFPKKTIEKAWSLIQRANTVSLLTHYRPDADGISACAAFEEILVKLGKFVETIYLNEPEFPFKRQPQKVLFNKHEQVPELLIVFDTANYERFYYPTVFHDIKLINVDHHVSNSINGTFNFIDTEASSACEILFTLIKMWDFSLIDLSIAESLLFGILSDSRVFHTQSTGANTLRIAAELIDEGADLFQLKTELFANKNPQIIKLWGILLDRVIVSEEKKAAWSYVTQQDLKSLDLQLSSLIGFNDFLTDISYIDVTMLFYEMRSGEIKVSLRSKKRDVNKLAMQFGGGGHKNAAGILSKKPIKELMFEVTNQL